MQKRNRGQAAVSESERKRAASVPVCQSALTRMFTGDDRNSVLSHLQMFHYLKKKKKTTLESLQLHSSTQGQGIQFHLSIMKATESSCSSKSSFHSSQCLNNCIIYTSGRGVTRRPCARGETTRVHTSLI